MAITNSAVIDIDMQVSLWYAYIHFRHTLRSGTTNWVYYAYLEESLWCSPQFVFPPAVREYSSPYSLLSVVLTVALMTGTPWVLCITLIRIRLSNVLKKHLLSISIFLGLDLFIQLFANLFKGWCFAVYFWSCLQIPDNNSLSDIVVKIFPTFLYTVSSLCKFFARRKLYLCAIRAPVLWVTPLPLECFSHNPCLGQHLNVFCLWFFASSFWSYIKSLIYFE